MPRNFIILFDGKEGTSPLVRMLNNFSGISIVHQHNQRGWEPFDRHNCGHISTKDLLFCLDGVLGSNQPNLERINPIYMKTAKRPLEFDVAVPVIGFKHRFNHPQKYPFAKVGNKTVDRALIQLFGPIQNKRYGDKMMPFLAQNRIVVFMAIRQDILRWALSYYRGNGFGGSSNNLQFKVASGKVDPNEIPRMTVEPRKLARLIGWCERRLAARQRLALRLRAVGIEVVPLFYEDFSADKTKYFTQFLQHIDFYEMVPELADVIAQDTKLKKVTPADLSQVVTNADELLSAFGDKKFAWG